MTRGKHGTGGESVERKVTLRRRKEGSCSSSSFSAQIAGRVNRAWTPPPPPTPYDSGHQPLPLAVRENLDSKCDGRWKTPGRRAHAKKGCILRAVFHGSRTRNHSWKSLGQLFQAAQTPSQYFRTRDMQYYIGFRLDSDLRLV